jgi:hypothetical protein
LTVPLRRGDLNRFKAPTVPVLRGDGKVKIGTTTLADITHWTLRTQALLSSYASSATAGYRRRVAGVKEGSGTLDGKLDPDDPISDDFDEGASVTLLLHLDATRFYTVPAVIESFRLEVDIDSGDVLGWHAEFSTNGGWTKPNYAS